MPTFLLIPRRWLAWILYSRTPCLRCSATGRILTGCWLLSSGIVYLECAPPGSLVRQLDLNALLSTGFLAPHSMYCPAVHYISGLLFLEKHQMSGFFISYSYFLSPTLIGLCKSQYAFNQASKIVTALATTETNMCYEWLDLRRETISDIMLTNYTVFRP